MQLVDNLSGNTKNIVVQDVDTDEISRSQTKSKNTNPTHTQVTTNAALVSKNKTSMLRYRGG